MSVCITVIDAGHVVLVFKYSLHCHCANYFCHREDKSEDDIIDCSMINQCCLLCVIKSELIPT